MPCTVTDLLVRQGALAPPAAIFQDGHNRTAYDRALPDLVSYHSLIRAASDESFAVEQTARLELEWWIIHRERAHYPPEAMLIRDTRQEAGSVSEQDWSRIGQLLDTSWTSLASVVSRQPSLSNVFDAPSLVPAPLPSRAREQAVKTLS